LRLSIGNQEILTTEVIIAQVWLPCHYGRLPRSRFYCSVHRETENFGGSKWTNVGNSSECASIVKRWEENRTKFCNDLDRKPLLSYLQDMHCIIQNEVKVLVKINMQAEHSGEVKKPQFTNNQRLKTNRRTQERYISNISENRKVLQPNSKFRRFPAYSNSRLNYKWRDFPELLTWT
jgi:hypothetical protein